MKSEESCSEIQKEQLMLGSDVLRVIRFLETAIPGLSGIRGGRACLEHVCVDWYEVASAHDEYRRQRIFEFHADLEDSPFLPWLAFRGSLTFGVSRRDKDEDDNSLCPLRAEFENGDGVAAYYNREDLRLLLG